MYHGLAQLPVDIAKAAILLAQLSPRALLLRLLESIDYPLQFQVFHPLTGLTLDDH